MMNEKTSLTGLQTSLLKATFLPGESGQLAWEHWIRQVDLDKPLDEGSFRLLPRLEKNLQKGNVGHPMMQRFKGAGRQNWLRNQLYFQTLTGAIAECYKANIPLIVLDGPALALLVDSHYHINVADDCRLLVHRDHGYDAVQCLRSAGWYPPPHLDELDLKNIVTSGSDLVFTNPKGSRLHLFWEMPPFNYLQGLEETFQEQAIRCQINSTPLSVLDPTDHILFLCLSDNSMPNRILFLRAIDILLILTAQVNIDWERIVDIAKEHRLGCPLKETLGFLYNILGGPPDFPLPAGTWDRIRSFPRAPWERIEGWYLRNPQDRWGRVPLLWFTHMRRRREHHWLARNIEFARLLQKKWALRYLGQVPFYACKRFLQGNSSGR